MDSRKFLIKPKVFTAIAWALAMCVAQAGAVEIRISAANLRSLQLNRQVTIIDVRAPDAFSKAHIQGARNVPSSAVATAGIEKSLAVVVYCGEDPCALTTGAVKRLSADGYGGVSILEGGLPAWIAKGYPVEGGLGQPAAQARKTDSLPATSAKAMLDAGTALAVDVRSAEEFHAGHLPGAVSAPLEGLDAALARLPKDKELIVYDRKADRSHKAQQKLAAAGFKAEELLGGIAGWVKRRMPLEVK